MNTCVACNCFVIFKGGCERCGWKCDRSNAKCMRNEKFLKQKIKGGRRLILPVRLCDKCFSYFKIIKSGKNPQPKNDLFLEELNEDQGEIEKERFVDKQIDYYNTKLDWWEYCRKLRAIRF